MSKKLESTAGQPSAPDPAIPPHLRGRRILVGLLTGGAVTTRDVSHTLPAPTKRR